MTTFAITVDAAGGPNFAQAFTAEAARVKAAAKAAGQRAADELLKRDKADIASAGNFGSRWQDALSATVTQAQSGSVRVKVTHAAPNYFSVFETGKHIRGKPILWIPFAEDAMGISAKNFGGPLFEVKRKGKPPLLVSSIDHEVEYIGLKAVDLSKRFHFDEIEKEVGEAIGGYFTDEMSKGG